MERCCTGGSAFAMVAPLTVGTFLSGQRKLDHVLVRNSPINSSKRMTFFRSCKYKLCPSTQNKDSVKGYFENCHDLTPCVVYWHYLFWRRNSSLVNLKLVRKISIKKMNIKKKIPSEGSKHMSLRDKFPQTRNGFVTKQGFWSEINVWWQINLI